MENKIIKRDIYLKKLVERKQNRLIKIITGVRRSGKSFLLFKLYYDYLLSIGVKEDNIIKIDLEDFSNIHLYNPFELDKEIRKRLKNIDGDAYLFIDEIQNVEEVNNPYLENGISKISFSNVLLGLMKVENLDIYITGSNSKMLSSDILTEFRGRGDEVRVYPLSFREFYSSYEGNEDSAYKEYSLYGGLPFLREKKSDESKKEYLTSLIKETYLKDIIDRNRINEEKEDILSSLLKCLSSSIGSLTSTEKLAATINSVKKLKKGEEVSNITIKKYIGFLEDSFLINKVKRFDVKGKNYFKNSYKYYFTDLGLRNTLLNMSQIEETHIMENLIYNELIFRGYSVDVGVVKHYCKDVNGKTQRITNEIDFVVNNGFNKCYIQSCFLLNDENRERELKPFSMIKNEFKKIIITKDEITTWYDNIGICHMDLKKFLLGENIF